MHGETIKFNTHVYPQQTAPFKIYTTVVLTLSGY